MALLLLIYDFSVDNWHKIRISKEIWLCFPKNLAEKPIKMSKSLDRMRTCGAMLLLEGNLDSAYVKKFFENTSNAHSPQMAPERAVDDVARVGQNLYCIILLHSSSASGTATSGKDVQLV